MKKMNIKKVFAETLELPKELVCDSCKLSITGFCEFEIVNYKSLIEYESNIIRINTDEKLIRIDGENLVIKNITDDELAVTGNILSIIFE